MSSVLSVSTIIQIGQASVYIAANDLVVKKMRNQPALDPKRELLLAMESDSINWQYAANPSDTTLQQSANYLYALSYPNAALNLGGIVASVGDFGFITTLSFVQIQFIVGTSTMTNGQTVLTINDTNILSGSMEIFLSTDFLEPNLSGQFSYTVVLTTTTATITFNQGVNTGDRFTIRYVKTS